MVVWLKMMRIGLFLLAQILDVLMPNQLNTSTDHIDTQILPLSGDESMIGEWIEVNNLTESEIEQRCTAIFDLCDSWCKEKLAESKWLRFRNWLLYQPIIWRFAKNIESYYKERNPERVYELIQASGWKASKAVGEHIRDMMTQESFMRQILPINKN